MNPACDKMFEREPVLLFFFPTTYKTSLSFESYTEG